ncbi:MAG: T9SS type A sorting domain-containing protein [Bacteroidia bacterium]
MRTIFFILLSCFSLGSMHAQISGKLFIAYSQSIAGITDSIGYYMYPSGDFTKVADFSARDMAREGDYLFCAPTPGLGGRFDTMQVINIRTDQVENNVPSNFTVGNIGVWNGKLVVSCGEAPYLRVLDAMPPFTEDFNALPSNSLNKIPSGMTVYGDHAFLWTDSSLTAVNLSSKQVSNAIPFPHGFLNQSEFNSVQGAADSAYLMISMGRNLNSRDTVHVYRIDEANNRLEYRDEYLVSGLLAFPAVGAGDRIHFSRYKAYYDATTGSIVQDVIGQSFVPTTASSYDPGSETLVLMEESSLNRRFIWFDYQGSIINNLTPLMLPQNTAIIWSSLFLNNLALSNEEDLAIDWQLYPNPASQQLWINAPKEAVRYVVLDMQGREVLDGKIVDGNAMLQIGDLAAGAYGCKLVLKNGETTVRRFVKE